MNHISTGGSAQNRKPGDEEIKRGRAESVVTRKKNPEMGCDHFRAETLELNLNLKHFR